MIEKGAAISLCEITSLDTVIGVESEAQAQYVLIVTLYSWPLLI